MRIVQNKSKKQARRKAKSRKAEKENQYVLETRNQVQVLSGLSCRFCKYLRNKKKYVKSHLANWRYWEQSFGPRPHELE